MAVHQIDAARCPCCGHDMARAHDPDTEGRWQPEVDRCYLGAARREYAERHKDDDLQDHLVSWRLLPPGQEVVDPLDAGEFTPERAAAEQAALRERLGIA